MSGDSRAALRCPCWPKAIARAARSGLDSTRRAAWHRAGRSPLRFVVRSWESDDELGDSLLIRRSHSPTIPGQERLSRASWRTELAPEVMRGDSVVADFALEWQRGYEFDDLSSTAPGHNPNSAGEHPVVGWKRAMRTDRDPDGTVRRFLSL